MNKKQIIISSTVGVALIGIGTLVYFLMPRELGWLGKDGAEDVFKGSNVTNGKKDVDVTGAVFFKVVKEVFGSSDKIIHSTCAIGAYDGDDKTGKGAFMVEVVKEASSIIYGWSGGKKKIEELKEKKEEDLVKAFESAGDDRKKGVKALADLLVHRILYKKYDEGEKTYAEYYKHWNDGDVKKRVTEIEEKIEKGKNVMVSVGTTGKEPKIMSAVEFVIHQIHESACKIPSDSKFIVESKRRGMSEAEEKMRTEHENAVNKLQEEWVERINAVKKESEDNIKKLKKTKADSKKVTEEEEDGKAKVQKLEEQRDSEIKALKEKQGKEVEKLLEEEKGKAGPEKKEEEKKEPESGPNPSTATKKKSTKKK